MYNRKSKTTVAHRILKFASDEILHFNRESRLADTMCHTCHVALSRDVHDTFPENFECSFLRSEARDASREKQINFPSLKRVCART